MSRRFAYPFLPEISRQLGEPLSNVQNVLAAASGVGIASPLFGPLSDRYGRKPMILSALTLMLSASVFGTLLPRFWMFAVMMLAFGVTKMIYDPAMQAYVGDRIPYNRRALAIGTTELSWAGSLLVIAPLAAFLLDRFGIQTVFAALAVASVFAILIMWIFVPNDTAADHPTGKPQRATISTLEAWRIIFGNPVALAAVGFSLLLMMANELFFINYSAWMEPTFDMQLVALGTVTIVIAVAEVFGEFGVITLADRFGKRRMAFVSALISACAYISLPFLSFNLVATLIGLFVAFMFFEMSIVAAIPLFTEIMPQARSAMMSGIGGAASLGRMLGAALGAFIFNTSGSFVLTCLIATIIGLAAFFLMWRYVQEHHETAST